MENQTNLEKLRRIISGENGNERNGISMNRKAAIRMWDGDYFYYAKDHPEIKRYTLACCEGQYAWIEVKHEIGRGNFSDKIEEQVSEEDAAYLLRYGRFEKDAGEV